MSLSPTPGGEGRLHNYAQDLADPKSLGLHPSLEQSRRQGEGSQQGHRLREPRSSKQPRKDPYPTWMAEGLDLTVPRGCSLGEGSPVLEAGLLALDQTRCQGERRPFRGACSPVAILQGAGGAEGGRASRCWRAPQLAHFPISGGGTSTRLPASPPPAVLLCDEQVARAVPAPTGAGHMQPPGTQLPHVARWRRGHPQPSRPRSRGPAPSRAGGGGGVGGDMPPAGRPPAPPHSQLLGRSRAHAGGGDLGAEASRRPHNVERMPARYQALSPSHSPLARRLVGSNREAQSRRGP